MQRLLVACLALTSVPGQAAPPTDSDRTVVGVLPLSAPDEIALGERAPLADAVRRGLERGATTTTDVTPPVDCDSACLAETAAKRGASHLVRVSVAKDGPDWVIRGEIFDASGKSQSVNEATCEICGTAELGSTVADLAAGMATEIRLAGRLAELVLTGTPEGATVSIDGDHRGTTPYRGTLEPGEHTIVLSKPGFGDQTISWAGRAGVSEAINYSLGTDVEGADADRCESETPRPLAAAKPLGWVGIGAGIAALGTGIGLIAIHDRDHAQTCVEGFVDAQGDCPFQYRTLVPGAIVAGVGAGLIAGGVAAIVIANKRARDEPGKPQARLGLGPSSVNVRVRF